MGPGDRIKFEITPGWQLGIYYLRWPYTHTIGINLLKFRVELGFGPSYIDDNYKG